MKKQIIKTTRWLVAAATLNMSSITKAQNVGINANGVAPNNSAMLDVDVSSLPNNNKKGLLIPRVSLTSNTDVTTIPSPANSLVVYNTNASMTGGNGAGFYYWDAGAGKWIYMASPANGPGNAGQVLVSQGAGNPPQWQNISAGGAPTFINPHNIISGFTGHHQACISWYVPDPNGICSCGETYDTWNDWCNWTGGTTNTPNACPCAAFSGPYPSNTNNYNWQTVNLTGVVPPGTKAVIVQYYWAITTPDSGDQDAFVLARANSSSPTYVVTRGMSGGSGDEVAGGGQSVIPIDVGTLTFQYAIEYPGFNLGVTLQVIGYYQ